MQEAKVKSYILHLGGRGAWPPPPSLMLQFDTKEGTNAIAAILSLEMRVAFLLLVLLKGHNIRASLAIVTQTLAWRSYSPGIKLQNF